MTMKTFLALLAGAALLSFTFPAASAEEGSIVVAIECVPTNEYELTCYYPSAADPWFSLRTTNLPIREAGDLLENLLVSEAFKPVRDLLLTDPGPENGPLAQVACAVSHAEVEAWLDLVCYNVDAFERIAYCGVPNIQNAVVATLDYAATTVDDANAEVKEIKCQIINDWVRPLVPGYEDQYQLVRDSYYGAYSTGVHLTSEVVNGVITPVATTVFCVPVMATGNRCA